MTKLAAVITPEGKLEGKRLPEGEEEYEWLNKLVGGYFESPSIIYPPLSNLTMYVNEEGKIIDLPCNPVATKLVGYWGLDMIAGPLVILGEVDDEGDTPGLTDLQFEAVRTCVNIITGQTVFPGRDDD